MATSTFPPDLNMGVEVNLVFARSPRDPLKSHATDKEGRVFVHIAPHAGAEQPSVGVPLRCQVIGSISGTMHAKGLPDTYTIKVLGPAEAEVKRPIGKATSRLASSKHVLRPNFVRSAETPQSSVRPVLAATG